MKVWQCESVKVWKCESVKVWKCENFKKSQKFQKIESFKKNLIFLKFQSCQKVYWNPRCYQHLWCLYLIKKSNSVTIIASFCELSEDLKTWLRRNWGYCPSKVCGKHEMLHNFSLKCYATTVKHWIWWWWRWRCWWKLRW